MQTFLCLLANFLLLNLSYVESKPHLTNFFMNLDADQNGWENIQLSDNSVVESHTDLISERESEHRFTWEDFPQGKSIDLKILI